MCDLPPASSYEQASIPVQVLALGRDAEICPGLVTNSILFCRLFTINDLCAKQVCFLQTYNQGLLKLILTVPYGTSTFLTQHN